MKNLIIKIAEEVEEHLISAGFPEATSHSTKYYFYAVYKEEDDESNALLTSSLYVSIAECAAAAVELLPLASFSSEWAGHEDVAVLTRNSLVDSIVKRWRYHDERMFKSQGEETLKIRFIDWINRDKEIIQEEMVDILATKARAKMLGIALD